MFGNSKDKEEIERLKGLLSKKEKENNELQSKISDLETDKKIQSTLNRVIAILGSETSADAILKALLPFLKESFQADYAGIYKISGETHLTLYHSDSYTKKELPELPISMTLMGRALGAKQAIAVSDVANYKPFIPINQKPGETNVLLLPFLMQGRPFAVIRLSNLDANLFSSAGTMAFQMRGLIERTMEFLEESSSNKRLSTGLKASLMISRLLEKKMGKSEILEQVFNHLPRLLDFEGAIIAMLGKERVLVVQSTPPNFSLAGDNETQNQYIRKLVDAYPGGEATIPDITNDRRWSRADVSHRSLLMAPIRNEHQLIGVIILAGKTTTSFTETEETLLDIVATQTSITMERAIYYQKQEMFATKDGLTGLYNRRLFNESIEREVEKAHRYNRPFSIIMFDIDHFKNFNDTYGHDMGDKVLKVVAKLVADTVRTSDLVYRYGGEEFIIICPETEKKNCAILALRINKLIAADRSIPGIPPITVSLGVTEIIKSDTSATITKRVDDLLYQSKENGRNRVTMG